MKSVTMAGVAFLAFTVASCQKNSEPVAKPPTADGRPAVAAGGNHDSDSVLEIRNHKELTLEPGIKLNVWTLQASQVQELTARLLLIKDGKSEMVQEAVYKWDKWPASKPKATWQLYYSLQDGEPFGAKNKWLPALTLKFDDNVPERTTTKRSSNFLEGEFRIQQSEARKDNTVDSARAEVIYYAFYDPTKGDSSFSLSRTVDALIAASKGGRTAVAIVLEWKPIPSSK